MNQKRIFLSIILPEKIKQNIFSITSDWPQKKYKIVKKENLHFVIFTFGYFPENKIYLINESLNKIIKKIQPFYIETTKIDSFPLNSLIKKIIFIKIKESLSVNTIREELNKERELFKKENYKLIKKDHFIPHVTLAQVKIFETQTKLDRLINSNEFSEIKIKVDSLHLMESKINKNVPEYKIIKTFNIKKK